MLFYVAVTIGRNAHSGVFTLVDMYIVGRSLHVNGLVVGQYIPCNSYSLYDRLVITIYDIINRILFITALRDYPILTLGG